MNFKDRVYQLRKEAGLTQVELGEKIGVTGVYVGFWESGRKVPTVETMKAIAKVFDVSLDYLNGLSDVRTIA